MKGHPGVPTDSSVLRMLETSQTLFLPPERITDRPFWAGHVPFALWLMEQHRPQLTVELGTETGVSLAAFSQRPQLLILTAKSTGLIAGKENSTPATTRASLRISGPISRRRLRLHAPAQNAVR